MISLTLTRVQESQRHAMPRNNTVNTNKVEHSWHRSHASQALSQPQAWITQVLADGHGCKLGRANTAYKYCWHINHVQSLVEHVLGERNKSYMAGRWPPNTVVTSKKRESSKNPRRHLHSNLSRSYEHGKQRVRE
jgi:hypothetical protein